MKTIKLYYVIIELQGHTNVKFLTYNVIMLHTWECIATTLEIRNKYH